MDNWPKRPKFKEGPITNRTDIVFASTKTYCHSVGLSVAFRQHKATSHCRFIHGYALEVVLTFACSKLDETNWVMDFGGLKPVKKWLEDNFDHKLLVAYDDPMMPIFAGLDNKEGFADCNDGIGYGYYEKAADLRIVKATGCEAFALEIFEHVEQWLNYERRGLPQTDQRVYLTACEVKEHRGNSAKVIRGVA